MLPYDGEATCTAIIKKAQENIDTILKPNLKSILRALQRKTAKDAIVVYNGYARFFNTENESCATAQAWNIVKWLPQYWFKTALKVTVARRKLFNTLVVNINQAIQDSITDISGELNYTIGFSNWDPWAIDGVKGQMCDPLSTGAYPDPKQPDLQFFKPDTKIPDWTHDELRRRSGVDNAAIPDSKFSENTMEIDPRIYNTLLWNSANPGADVVHKLDSRAPSPPNCPGDGDFDVTLGVGLPDTFGKLFHPNELGHQTIASFTVAKAIDLRAKVLGLGPQTCEVKDVFKCWQKQGRKGYAQPNKMNENYKKFCDEVKQPAHTAGWRFEKTCFVNTPDEQSFVLQLGDSATTFNKDQCLDSFDRIINGCDGNDPENPMNFKYGGQWRRGQYTYEINIKRTNRPQKVKKAAGLCNGSYKWIFSSYEIKGMQQPFLALLTLLFILTASLGVGWSSWDYGQQTILKNTKGCLGLGVTNYDFKYFDAPDEDGMEWKVTFRTPVFVNGRCFKNNKVVSASGGWTDGCAGNDP